MKVRILTVDTASEDMRVRLRADFFLRDGKVVCQGEPVFVKGWKQDPAVYQPEDFAREHPIMLDEGEDYLLALPDHYRDRSPGPSSWLMDGRRN